MTAEVRYRRGQPPRINQKGTCDSCAKRGRPLVLVTLAGADLAPRAFWVCRHCALAVERP